jgi:hypothetical protein
MLSPEPATATLPPGRVFSFRILVARRRNSGTRRRRRRRVPDYHRIATENRISSTRSHAPVSPLPDQRFLHASWSPSSGSGWGSSATCTPPKIPSVHAFEKVPLPELLAKSLDTAEEGATHNHLPLFDFWPDATGSSNDRCRPCPGRRCFRSTPRRTLGVLGALGGTMGFSFDCAIRRLPSWRRR